MLLKPNGRRNVGVRYIRRLRDSAEIRVQGPADPAAPLLNGNGDRQLVVGGKPYEGLWCSVITAQKMLHSGQAVVIDEDFL